MCEEDMPCWNPITMGNHTLGNMHFYIFDMWDAFVRMVHTIGLPAYVGIVTLFPLAMFALYMNEKELSE